MTSRLGAGIATLVRPPRATFEAQLSLVESWATRREESISEILAQLLPQAPFWASVLHLHPQRHPYTFELLGIALQVTMMAVMRFKHALACPRPSEYSPNIQPVVLMPGYSALPSGHATEAMVAAKVLLALTGQDAASPLAIQLHGLADRIARLRVVAGLHFPVDSAAGHVLGEAIAGWFVALATRNDGAAPGGAWTQRGFDGAAYPAAEDWDWATRPAAAEVPYEVAQVAQVDARQAAPTLAWLWDCAREEQVASGF
jgi:hypothetical protein